MFALTDPIQSGGLSVPVPRRTSRNAWTSMGSPSAVPVPWASAYPTSNPTSPAEASAREKRIRKGIDLMVANDVSRPDAGFEVATNAVTLIDVEGERTVPPQSKERVAAAILDRVEQLMRARLAAPVRA